MCFKWRAFYGCVVVGLALGCAGENQKFGSVPDIQFQSPKFQCLRNADVTISRFLRGTLPTPEVGAFWNCLDHAIVQFVTYVRGAEGHNYTPREFADFLDTFFFDERGIENETAFIEELMEIKRLVIGGSTTMISYHDLYVETRKAFRNFKDISENLNPHMRVLYKGLSDPKEKSGLNEREIRDAIAALRAAGVSLGQMIEKGSNRYSFTRLRQLITELERFIQQNDPEFELESAKKFMPLMGELKGLLIAPPNDLIRSEDWGTLFDTLTATISWGLNYRFFIEGQGWDHGEPLTVLNEIVQEIFGHLAAGIAKQPGERFDYVDLDRLAAQLEESGLLPEDLDQKTVSVVLRRLGERVLSRPGGVGAGLDRDDLKELRAEVERWFEAQFYVSQFLAADIPGINGGARELAELLNTPWPLVRDLKSRLEFSDRVFDGIYDLDGLTALNWQRALIRALMRGYADQTGPDGASGLSLEQFKTLANDWDALAGKLGLFESGEAERTASKIFMEANLFMPNSNGDESLDFIEAVQYLSYAISGLNASTEVKNQLDGKCAVAEAPNKFRPDCLRQELFDRRGGFLGHLPMAVDFIGDHPGTWNQFMKHLEATTRLGAEAEPFSRGDVVEVMVLLQYVETFFAKYDLDGNQRISVDETLTAYPVYKNSLDQIVRNSFGITMGDGDLRALFTFLFRYGKPPQSTFGGMLKFLNWRWNRGEWEYDVDRMRVIEILAELNSRR